MEGKNENQWSRWELETAQVKAAQAQYKYRKLERWQVIEQQAKSPENYVTSVAADHFTRYQHDFALAKQLHLNSLRTGIEWSRIEPEEGVFSKEAIIHYRKYFDELQKKV